MSTDQDTTRIVRSWLEDGVTALPDRVLDAVLDQLPATPQRRRLSLTWRFAQMNRYARMAIAAAAVLVVVIVGYNLLPRTNPGVGGPVSTPTLAPTSGPAPTTGPSPTAPLDMPIGAIVPGTHAITRNTSAPFTITVPAGWTFDKDSFLSKGGPWTSSGVMFTTWIISHVYTDSCQWQGTLKPAGTKALLGSALAAQKGHTSSPATEVTIGGRPATQVVLSLAAGFVATACNQSIVRLWPDAGPDESGGLLIHPGQSTTVYVIEQNGQATAILTVRNPNATPAELAELQSMLDSIQFQG